MSKEKSGLNLNFGLPIFLLIFAIIGYFIYGGITGFFGILLIGIILSFLLLLSLIPYAGGVIYLLLNWFMVIPLILDFTGLHWSGLITIMLVLFSVPSIIFSVFLGLIISAMVDGVKKW